MKIGIYGGTFNPPHLGHLTAAAAVIATLKLDKLLLIPASIPPHIENQWLSIAFCVLFLLFVW